MNTLQLTYGKGYSGKTGNKCWVAEITGSDNKFGLSRNFIEATKVEREHFNRPRTMITFTYELSAGLYEISQHGERSYKLVWEKDGELKRCNVDEARVKAIVALMDEGQEFEAARLATKPAPAAPAPAATPSTETPAQ